MPAGAKPPRVDPVAEPAMRDAGRHGADTRKRRIYRLKRDIAMVFGTQTTPKP